jgi:hypothetical protein
VKKAAVIRGLPSYGGAKAWSGHAEGVHVEFDQRLFFLALVRVLLAQADDGADRLGVVA